ncbi:MAG: peptide deformylase [Chloroflexota bacterium]
MAILRIRTVPDPILRQKARRVTSIDASVLRLIDNMIDTLKSAGHGVGLAATQVGRLLRIAVIELPDEPVIVLINPEIVKHEGERVVEEGCLSIPGYRGQVKRSVSVKVKYRNREGKEERLKCDDLTAQVVEHELDHLDGVLFTDHLVEPGKLEKIEPEETEALDVASPTPH